MITVAALYVDKLGTYPAIAKRGSVPARAPLRSNLVVDLDCWDESRDARLYDGPHPVVAHPPCGPWGRFRHLYRGNEYDCAPWAVVQVRRWGGVLEHPAGSKLWDQCGLPKPDVEPSEGGRLFGVVRAISGYRNARGDFTDSFGGYTIEVNQVEWGHVTRKRTWLYLVGVPRDALEAPPFTGREPTHWISGGRGRTETRNHTPVPPGIKVASAAQRRRTPPLFAEYLVRLARSVAASRRAA